MTTTKTSRLQLRATESQETLIKRGAAAARKSVSEFILESACKAAEEELLDQRWFSVDEETWEKLQDALNRPPRWNQGMADLLGKPAPWET